jgi:transcriptional regulator with XRE-family HTH domain
MQATASALKVVGVERFKKHRLLHDAAKLMGKQELARRLKISESLLDDWIRGEGTISDSRLMKLSEVLERWANRK